MRQLILLFTACISLTGCLPGMEFQSTGLKPNSVIYLAPPKGATQGGSAQEASQQSSELLQEKLIEKIEEKTSLTVKTSADLDDNLAVAPSATALAINQARSIEADYAMIVVLGEFQDTATLSFSVDNLTVNSIRIYSTSSDDVVFGLKRPHVQAAGGSSLSSLISRIAQQIANAIAENSET